MTLLIGNTDSIATRTKDSAISVADALARRTMPPVVRLVLDTMTSDEMARVAAHVKKLGAEVQLTNLIKLTTKRKHDAGLPKPALNESLVPSVSENGDISAWYTRLLYHTLSATKPDRCLVLWGPPGVGKTLAIERIGQMLEAQRQKRGISNGVLNGNRQVRAFVHFSCAEIEDKDGVNDFVRQVTEFAHSAPPDTVLVLDDFEALIESRRASDKLIAVMASSKHCRRVLVMNDFYERAFYKMRTHPLRENFQDLQVGRVDVPRLAAYLQLKVPMLKQADAIALDIATRSGGDVRAALISARIDAALMPTMLRNRATPGGVRGVGINADEHSALEPISVSVSRCAREPKPAVAARARFFDADEMTSAFEMLHVNTPRYVSGRSDLDEAAAMLLRLQTTADVFDSLSQADCYEQGMWGSNFAGADGENTDKEFLFNMSVGVPISQLGAGMKNFTRNLQLAPKMEFPLTKLRGVQKRNGGTVHSNAARSALVSRLGFNTTAGLVGAAAAPTGDDTGRHDDDDEIEETPEARAAPSTVTVGAMSSAACEVNDMRATLFGDVSRDRLLAALRSSKTKGKREPWEEMAWKDLCTITARCSAQGFFAEDFARECLLHLGASDERHEFTEAALRAAFERTNPRVAQLNVVAESGSLPAKRRKQAPTTSAPAKKKTNTIREMFTRLNEKE